MSHAGLYTRKIGFGLVRWTVTPFHQGGKIVSTRHRATHESLLQLWTDGNCFNLRQRHQAACAVIPAQRTNLLLTPRSKNSTKRIACHFKMTLAQRQQSRKGLRGALKHYNNVTGCHVTHACLRNSRPCSTALAKVSADGDRLHLLPAMAMHQKGPRTMAGPESEWVIRWQRERAITGIT